MDMWQVIPTEHWIKVEQVLKAAKQVNAVCKCLRDAGCSDFVVIHDPLVDLNEAILELKKGR